MRALGDEGDVTLDVFVHANHPFDDVKPIYEAKYPGVTLNMMEQNDVAVLRSVLRRRGRRGAGYLLAGDRVRPGIRQDRRPDGRHRPGDEARGRAGRRARPPSATLPRPAATPPSPATSPPSVSTTARTCSTRPGVTIPEDLDLGRVRRGLPRRSKTRNRRRLALPSRRRAIATQPRGSSPSS